MKRYHHLKKSSLQRFNALNSRYGKYLPLVSFIGGFFWDSLTLTRIDRLSDNLILLAYLLLLAGAIILLNLIEKEFITKAFILRYQNLYPLAVQFFLGGLFSSYVVFYFKSAALTKNWLFLLILVGLLVLNEFLENRLTNFYLQMTLLFWAALSFFLFFLPVILGSMATWVFISSGLLALGFIILVIFLLAKVFGVIRKIQIQQLSTIIIGIFLLFNLFYFMNWIPPVPLSLKSAGIYHGVKRVDDAYHLKYEKQAWYKFWKKSDAPFYYAAGDTVNCYASVFAPVKLNKNIFHRWQQFIPEKDAWVTSDKLGYQVVGGRQGGYRGYTRKINIQPGKWRVDIITDDDKTIGRLNFEIIPKENQQREFAEKID